MLIRTRFVCSIFVLLGAALPVSAKDLTSRLGVGIKNNTSESLPALATVYYPSADLGVTGGAGIDTRKDASKFTFNGGLRRILFREDNMNFYFGGQLGMVNYEDSVDGKKSGFELNAVFGGEFFLQGLESLAFTFEGGVGVASVKDVRFRTLADDPFRAGIVFYF